jgi:hypothetical protein
MRRSLWYLTLLVLLLAPESRNIAQQPRVPRNLGEAREVDTPTDFREPGVHTMRFRNPRTRDAGMDRNYGSTCGRLDPLFPALEGMVGWGQAEIGWLGQNCMAFVLQRAIHFDAHLLFTVQHKTIDRAILRFDEAEAPNCPLVAGYTYRCWQSGNGHPEPKPNGCVVVRVPTIDWLSNGAIKGLLPATEGARRISATEWDVTRPMSWQLIPSSAPLGAQTGYGLLLTGGPALSDLTAQDNTVCVSQISNLVLEVTYTVRPTPTPVPVPR